MVDIPEIKKLEQELEAILIGSLAKLLLAIKRAWAYLRRIGTLTLATALSEARRLLQEWPSETYIEAEPFVRKMFATSFAAGMIDTELKVSPDQGDEMSLDWINHERNGFVPALQNLSEESMQIIRDTLEDSYKIGGEFDLDPMVNKIRDQTTELGKERAELIVRTETAKISALGRIAAWGKDQDRDWYNYWWIATPDDRVKDISLKFEREGPYEYGKIKSIWEHDHHEPQLVRNRKTGKMEYQISAFNCRCTVARSPKQRQQLVDEGKVSQERTYIGA
jgi:hypothetical protein